MGAVTNRPQVVFLGESGFPMGLATIQRITLMAKALLLSGNKATVVCRKGVWKEGVYPNLGAKGVYEGIDYVYTSKSVYRPKGFLKRNLAKITGMYGEFLYLKALHREQQIRLAVISEFKVIHLLRYKLYAQLIGFPLANNFVELASSMQHRAALGQKINDYLLDKWAIKWFDGALPISDKLEQYYRERVPTKPCMKLPILCDFDKFNVPRNPAEPYFLYCGSIRYKEVRDFVLSAYRGILSQGNMGLHMIISGGNPEASAQLQQEINAEFPNSPVKIHSNIPYADLVRLYVNASALLIPLRPTVQDAARFPHKIGEYLASGNPVVTTNVGEIRNYFEDGKTALVADAYAVEQFREKMGYVLRHPEQSRTIGSNGKDLGLKEFDYRAHAHRLQEFLRQL